MDNANSGRPRGRPRLPVDHDAVADAMTELSREGGYEAVSVGKIGEKREISRATPYRTVPTKRDLLGIFLDRTTRELTGQIETAIREIADPAEQLIELVRVYSDASVRVRDYLPVVSHRGDMPEEVVQRWHASLRHVDKPWQAVIAANMEAGYIENGDPVITTRLVLGMFPWASRWFRSEEKVTSAQIASEAIRLLRLAHPPSISSG